MKLYGSNTNRNVGLLSAVTRSLILAGTCVCCAQTVALANTERDLDSHEHGAANINVVIDGATVFVELESPWNNLVGFEHSPTTESQHSAVDGAMDTLADPNNILSFNSSAGCQVGTASVESSLDLGAEHDHEEDHDHEEKEHGEHEHDEHAKDEEHEHKDEEHADHDDHGDEETHSEVLAMYSFDCENPDELESVEIRLFDLFDGFSEIDYQAAGPSGQAGDELIPSNTTLDLSGVR